MMYEETFGTDWSSLARDEAIRRAFALGVAASLGHPDPEEYDRVAAEIDSSYDQSLVELAYSRGRNRGQHERSDADSPEAVWSTLVETDDVVDPDVPERDHYGPASNPPKALSNRGPAGERTGAIDLPAFLREDGH